MKEEKKKSNKFKIPARIIAVILAFVSMLFIVMYLESYVADNHRKAEIVEKPAVTVPKEIKVDEFSLSIPKINVEATVIPKVDGMNEKIYQEALKKGVAHYKGTALPNSGSNMVIFGHSSSILGFGQYSKIFARLDDLEKNDEISINYNGETYKYAVESKRVVSAKEVSVLSPTEREQLTLITCWPVGTNQKRLIVIAKPI